jgi:hypothetical protein
MIKRKEGSVRWLKDGDFKDPTNLVGGTLIKYVCD